MPVILRAFPGEGGPIQSRYWKKEGWKWLVGCLCAATLLGWFLHAQLSARSFDWHLLAATVSGLRWPWLLLALVPSAGTYYGRALRWAVFLKPLKPHPSMSKLVSATVIGFTAITLFGRAGDFVRPYLISVKEEVPLTSQIAAWILERIFDLLMATLVLGFGLTQLKASGIHLGPKLAWLLTFGGQIVGGSCLVVLILILSMRHFGEPVRRRLVAALRFLPEPRFRKAERWINTFVQGVDSTKSDGALLLVLTYSILEWALIAACYWCLAKAFSGVVYLTFVDILIFMGFVAFGGVVQVPGIGGGTQVTAVFVLTELFGVRLELATVFALLIWILTFVAVVPVGLALALKEGLDWHSLRRIGREVPK